MFKTLMAALLLTCSTSVVWAQTEKTIILNDGSQIQGRVVAIDGGRYVIESKTLGEIKIPEADIQSITKPGEAQAMLNMPTPNPTMNTSTPGGNYSGQMQAIQGQIVNNPALMSEIEGMASDPEILAIISDPAFMQAAQSGNLQSLQHDPRMQKLLSNPKMQAFVTKFSQQQ